MFAAAWQAMIGNVLAGSLFATAQGIAMGAPIPVAIKAVGACVGSLITVVLSTMSIGAGVINMFMTAASAVGIGIGSRRAGEPDTGVEWVLSAETTSEEGVVHCQMHGHNKCYGKVE
jgi:hypothetical protein